MNHRTRGAARGALVALSLAVPASAQIGLHARPVLPYAQRPTAVATVVVEATAARPVRDDVEVHVLQGWSGRESVVRRAVQLDANAPALFSLPVPLGPFNQARVTLDGAQTSLGTRSQHNPDVTPTYVAVIGLGRRFATRLCAAGERLECAALEASSLSGDPMIPAAPFAWSGTHAAVIDAATLRGLSPTARAAVDAWVRQGGVLAVTLRTPSDRAVLGPEAESAGTTLPFGTAWAHGLGLRIVTALDPSTEDWDARPEAALRLRLLAAGLQDTGISLSAPGDLTLEARFSDADGTLRQTLRPVFDARRPLGPMAAAIALYIVAVGVLLHRNRSARAPLKVLLRLPALAFAVLGATFATTWLMRSHRTEARAVALLDLAAGQPDAVERVFVGITAGGARPVAFAPPAGHFARLQTSENTTGGWLRWDGARLAVEGARLVLWETAALYSEGPAALGGTITLSYDATGRPTVHNGTALALSRGAVLDRDGVSVWPVEAIAPGATARAADLEVHVGGDNSRRLFGDAAAEGSPAMRFLDDALGGAGSRPGPMQYFATAPLPASIAQRLRALDAVVVQGAAIVRAIDTTLPPAVETLPRARLDHLPRTVGSNPSPPAPEPVPVRGRHVDAGDASDASWLLEALTPPDAAAPEAGP